MLKAFLQSAPLDPTTPTIQILFFFIIILTSVLRNWSPLGLSSPVKSLRLMACFYFFSICVPQAVMTLHNDHLATTNSSSSSIFLKSFIFCRQNNFIIQVSIIPAGPCMSPRLIRLDSMRLTRFYLLLTPQTHYLVSLLLLLQVLWEAASCRSLLLYCVIFNRSH